MTKAIDVTQLLSLNETRLHSYLVAMSPDEVSDFSFGLQTYTDSITKMRVVVAQVLEAKQLEAEQQRYVAGLSDEQKAVLAQSLGLVGVPPRK